MPKQLLATAIMEPELEAMRLAALASTGILDTAPEACYDAITRLCADYFKADSVHLGFADESRVWIKSYAGEPIREIPRRHSTFEMVLAADGPVEMCIRDRTYSLRNSFRESGNGNRVL